MMLKYENMFAQAMRARDTLITISEIVLQLPTTFENGSVRYNYGKAMNHLDNLVDDLKELRAWEQHGEERRRQSGSGAGEG